MLHSCCGENTRGIDQMPASILHFLAISNESCTHPRLSGFHVFDDGQKFAPSVVVSSSQLYSDTLIPLFMVAPTPWGSHHACSLWLQVLVCLYDTNFAAGCWLSSSLIPVPLVVGIIRRRKADGLRNIIGAPADFKIMPNPWWLSHHELF